MQWSLELWYLSLWCMLPISSIERSKPLKRKNLVFRVSIGSSQSGFIPWDSSSSSKSWRTSQLWQSKEWLSRLGANYKSYCIGYQFAFLLMSLTFSVLWHFSIYFTVKQRYMRDEFKRLEIKAQMKTQRERLIRSLISLTGIKCRNIQRKWLKEQPPLLKLLTQLTMKMKTSPQICMM